MKRWTFFVALFCVQVVSGELSGEVSFAADDGHTHVFQIHGAQQKAEISSQFETRPITFGLTAQEKESIYKSTMGQVDLRHFYFVRLSSGDQPSISGTSGEARDWGIHPRMPLPPHAGAPLPGIASASDDLKEYMDPDLLGQWWASKYRMSDVWDLATGKGVTIADCDTGFYTNESDLKLNLLLEHSKDLAARSNSRQINDGRFVFHGTAVAALITGVRDERGTNGIAFNAKLVPLQYFNFDPDLDFIDKEEATARCILHAIKIPKVKVIVVQNQTTGGSAETFAGTREAIKLAIRSGISVVSAAGNSSIELKTEERYDTGSIIVGAVNEHEGKAMFSNYGRRVTIAAFGEKLYTLYGPSGRMDAFGGTTAAAAQVAAAIALMLEVNPELTPLEIKDILETTAHRDLSNRDVGGVLRMLDAVTVAASL